MSDIERIIIDAKAGNLVLQVKAAHAAIVAGIEEGGLFGMSTEGKVFGESYRTASGAQISALPWA